MPIFAVFFTNLCNGLIKTHWIVYRVVEASHPDVEGSARGGGIGIAGQQDPDAVPQLNVPEINNIIN